MMRSWSSVSACRRRETQCFVGVVGFIRVLGLGFWVLGSAFREGLGFRLYRALGLAFRELLVELVHSDSNCLTSRYRVV